MRLKLDKEKDQTCLCACMSKLRENNVRKQNFLRLNNNHYLFRWLHFSAPTRQIPHIVFKINIMSNHFFVFVCLFDVRVCHNALMGQKKAKPTHTQIIAHFFFSSTKIQ